jgi:hypothetical protein
VTASATAREREKRREQRCQIIFTEKWQIGDEKIEKQTPKKCYLLFSWQDWFIKQICTKKKKSEKVKVFRKKYGYHQRKSSQTITAKITAGKKEEKVQENRQKSGKTSIKNNWR